MRNTKLRIGLVTITTFALVTSAILFRRLPVAQAASKAPAFGREVIVDHQRVTGEPSLAIDSQDRIYVSGPFGFSTM